MHGCDLLFLDFTMLNCSLDNNYTNNDIININNSSNRAVLDIFHIDNVQVREESCMPWSKNNNNKIMIFNNNNNNNSSSYILVLSYGMPV